jgi:nucleotide-binding universal stress UspA family protein
LLKALVPIDGSDNALCAVRHVINLIQDREPLEVHLLNVQPDLHAVVTSFILQGIVDDYHLEEGQKALSAACDLLKKSGIDHRTHIMIGHVANVIAECAMELRCHKVIMGTRGLGTVTQLILGSVTHEVIHQMDPRIPVTLVKAGYQ